MDKELVVKILAFAALLVITFLAGLGLYWIIASGGVTFLR